MAEALPLVIIIVEKNGNIKEMEIKNFKEEELFKKCGFKKSEDFVKHHEWNLKLDGNKYLIMMYGKIEGRANSENKYDFPPPIDTKLFFGNCALVAKIKKDENKYNYINLTCHLWHKLYEKLFGGFEDLTSNAIIDENEEDELAHVPKNKKTKDGYLKDGFVVDSDGDNMSEEYSSYDENSNNIDDDLDTSEDNGIEADIILEDIGSELSEDEYDYND